MPTNPKRSPPRKGELPFDDSDILKADDPRPQRVTQYPATGARLALKKVEEHIPTSVFDTEKHDQEMRATYGAGESHKPAFLYVERGPGAGQLVQLKQGPLVIGRASVSDLRLQHPSISRRHAQFKRIGEQFFVKDLGSQNGTFVNKNKIETELEVFPGDLIAMGNALLKLRGPLNKGEALPAPKNNNKSNPKKAAARTSVAIPATRQNAVPQKSSSMVKVAIFAGAMGFGLAGVLAFALVKGVGNNSPVRIASKTKPMATPEAELNIALDDVKVAQAKKVDDAIARKMEEKRQADALKKAAAPPPVEKEEPAPTDDRAPKPIVAKATTTAPATTKKAAAEDDEEAAPKAASPNAKKAQILKDYEKGNAEGSLEAAKKAGDRELQAKLGDFIAAYDAADNAVNSNNGGAAIKNFEKALKLDEQLSSGWGVYGGKIRKQLATLYTLVGLQHVKNDNADNAKIAFQAALKHDPDNERAKEQLKKLGGTVAKADDDEEEKPAPKKKAAAAPAKKTSAEPKSRSQAIDDAFGD